MIRHFLYKSYSVNPFEHAVGACMVRSVTVSRRAELHEPLSTKMKTTKTAACPNPLDEEEDKTRKESADGLDPEEYPAVLWRLEFGVGIFHQFFLINFVGARYCRGELQRRT